MKKQSRLLVFVLAALLAIVTFSMGKKVDSYALSDEFIDATEVESGDYCKYPKNSDVGTMYKVVLKDKSYLQFENGTSNKYEIVVYNSSETEVDKFTEADATSDNSWSAKKNKTKTLAAGTYYFSIRGTSSSNYEDFSGVKVTVFGAADNTSAAKAKTVKLPTSGTVNLEYQATKVDNTYTKYYYKLVVDDKAYYDLKDSNVSNQCIYKGTKEKDSALLAKDSDLDREEVLLDKGSYLLVSYSLREGDTFKIVIKCKDFKDITKISVKKTYEVNVGAKKKVSFSFSPSKNESTVKYKSDQEKGMEFTKYDYDKKESLTKKNEAYIYGRKLGTYTGTITTSEGLTQKIKVIVKPGPVSPESIVATAKSSSKSSIKITWKGSGNFYKIYQKKGKKFKQVKTTKKNSVTINVKSGSDYKFKIESCYKKGSKIVASTMGKEFTAITVSGKAPSITSAYQSGKTAYTARYWKWVKINGRWRYRQYGNTSRADVVVKYSKVKGATYYQFNAKGYSPSSSHGDIKEIKNSLFFIYSGRIGSKSEAIKVRAVRKKGNAVAYGPWSSTKTVSISGN